MDGLVAGGVDTEALLHLLAEVPVDGARLVVHLHLPEARHPEEQVLIVDETLVLWETLVVVPHLPVHAIEERPLCELLEAFSLTVKEMVFRYILSVVVWVLGVIPRPKVLGVGWHRFTFQKSSMVDRLLKVAWFPADSGVSRKS